MFVSSKLASLGKLCSSYRLVYLRLEECCIVCWDPASSSRGRESTCHQPTTYLSFPSMIGRENRVLILSESVLPPVNAPSPAVYVLLYIVCFVYSLVFNTRVFMYRATVSAVSCLIVPAVIRPPVRSNGRTYKMLVMFFFFFQRLISELPRPIAAKLRHMIAACVYFIN